jgi:hypothetical protein
MPVVSAKYKISSTAKFTSSTKICVEFAKACSTDLCAQQSQNKIVNPAMVLPTLVSSAKKISIWQMVLVSQCQLDHIAKPACATSIDAKYVLMVIILTPMESASFKTLPTVKLMCQTKTSVQYVPIRHYFPGLYALRTLSTAKQRTYSAPVPNAFRCST